MGENHLTYFKVENFKRFESFELNDIGQFNLIVGDNNVGKTSVLEALGFDTNVYKMLEKLQLFLFVRGIKFIPDFKKKTKNLLEHYLNDSKKKEIKFSFQIQKHTNENVLLSKCIERNNLTDVERDFLEKNSFESKVNDYSPYQLLNVQYYNNALTSVANSYNYIDLNVVNYSHSYFFFNQPIELVNNLDLFSSYFTDLEQRKKLIEQLKFFAPNIEHIERNEIDGIQLIQVNEKNSTEFKPLAYYGDGINKLFTILMLIRKNNGERLMIDEIDAGIHYSRFKDFWRTIFKSAIANDVQIFATTHNIECLKYFKEVLEEEEKDENGFSMKDSQREARCFSLVQQPDNSVKAFTKNFEQFQWAIDSENEIRD